MKWALPMQHMYIYEDLFILLKSSLSFDENRPTGFVAKFQPP